MKSMVTTVGKRVTDVREFLKESAEGNSVKYSAEKGGKHIIYIPYTMVSVIKDNGEETLEKSIVAIKGEVHEWSTIDGKYRTSICLKDIIRKDDTTGYIVNNGMCPICERIDDAWEIYNYRKDKEESTCKLVGEDKNKHMENMTRTFADERKAKKAKSYMYILVAKFKLDGTNIVIGKDKLPEYELKVMKLSSARVERMQKQIANAGGEFPGSELVIEYPVTDDKRVQVSQSTTSLPFPNSTVTFKFKDVVDKIAIDVNNFEWDGIEKSFPEWAGMSTEGAREVVNTLFAKWDEYKAELQVNPGARYMEYITYVPTSNPDMDTIKIPDSAKGGTDAQKRIGTTMDVNTMFLEDLKI